MQQQPTGWSLTMVKSKGKDKLTPQLSFAVTNMLTVYQQVAIKGKI